MKFNIIGADRDTGADCELVIEAADGDAASAIANAKGILVSKCFLLAETKEENLNDSNSSGIGESGRIDNATKPRAARTDSKRALWALCIVGLLLTIFGDGIIPRILGIWIFVTAIELLAAKTRWKAWILGAGIGIRLATIIFAISLILPTNDEPTNSVSTPSEDNIRIAVESDAEVTCAWANNVSSWGLNTEIRNLQFDKIDNATYSATADDVWVKGNGIDIHIPWWKGKVRWKDNI